MFVRAVLRWLARLARVPRWQWSRPPELPTLRLYTKANCPLCDEMKAELARARVRPAFRLEEVDIARDPTLIELHGRSIPVLEIGGRVAFKGCLTAEEFERKYARRMAEIRAEESSRDLLGGRESEHG